MSTLNGHLRVLRPDAPLIVVGIVLAISVECGGEWHALLDFDSFNGILWEITTILTVLILEKVIYFS